MAFPQVEATNHSVEAYDRTSHTVKLPANIEAGETLLIFFATDGHSTSVSFPEGWTEIFDVPTIDVSLAIAWRKADGEEGATITVTTGASQQSTHISYRISGATDPTSTPPEAGEVSTGTSAYPNPLELEPTGGSDEYLWIAVEGNDDFDTVSSYPTNYTDGEAYASSAGAGACNIGVARRELETDAENPGLFILDASEQWEACTVAVYPAPPVPPVVGRSFGFIIG